MESSFTFIVEQSVDVVASDGATVIGSLQSGVQYEGRSIDEHWVTMSLPDGSYGYVPAGQVRWDIVDVHIATPFPPPSPPVADVVPAPMASPVWDAPSTVGLGGSPSAGSSH